MLIQHRIRRPNIGGPLDHVLHHSQLQVDQSIRSEVLSHQGPLWGDDELWFHLSQIPEAQTVEAIIPMDPLVSSSLTQHGGVSTCRSWLYDQVNLDRDCFIITVVRIRLADHCHWVPVVWDLQGGYLNASSCDQSPDTAQHIHAVTDVLTTATGLQPGYREHRTKQVPEPALSGACGAKAIAWLWLAIGPTDGHRVMGHDSFRMQFALSLHSNPAVRQLHYLAGGQ